MLGIKLEYCCSKRFFKQIKKQSWNSGVLLKPVNGSVYHNVSGSLYVCESAREKNLRKGRNDGNHCREGVN